MDSNLGPQRVQNSGFGAPLIIFLNYRRLGKRREKRERGEKKKKKKKEGKVRHEWFPQQDWRLPPTLFYFVILPQVAGEGGKRKKKERRKKQAA